MTLILYHSSAESRVADKSAQLEIISVLNGTLRVGTSIINPNIDVDFTGYDGVVTSDEDEVQASSDDVVIPTLTSMMNSNYAYIKEFGRYYYITDIQTITNRIWRFIMAEDGKFSHLATLKNQYGYISRNEFDYDPMVEDTRISFKYEQTITETEVVNLSTATDITEFNSFDDDPDHNIAITFMTSESYESDYAVLNAPDGVLPSVKSPSLGASHMSSVVITNKGNVNTISSALTGDAKDGDTISSYITSIVAFPFELSVQGETAGSFKIGDTTHSVSTAEKYFVTIQGYAPKGTSVFSQYYKIAEFQMDQASSFLDYEPYSKYELYLPFVGWTDLSMNQLAGHVVAVYYVINYADGGAEVIITDKTDNKLIYTNTCQLGVAIAKNSSNAYDISIQRLRNTQNLVSGIIGGVGKVASSSYDTNMIGKAINSGVQIGNSINSFITSSSQTSVKASAVIPSGNLGLYLPQKCRIRKTSVIPTQNDTETASVFGRPLNQWRKLGDLTGYTEVGEIHLEGFGNATMTELNLIENELKTGIIL